MAYTGLTASLKIGNNDTIAYISNWSVEETKDTIELTKLGVGYKEKIPSLYSWSASADGTADFTSAANQKTLRNAMISGESVTVNFYLDSATYLTGTAIVESMSLDISAEDKGNISISLSGTDQLQLITSESAQA